MTPAARLQAAIEILDEVVAAARDEGDYLVTATTQRERERRAEPPRADDGNARSL